MQSILNRGSDTILNIGAWNDSPAAADLNQAITDTLNASETIAFVNTPTQYPFNSLLRRGADDNTSAGRGAEIGAWQTPYAKAGGVFPLPLKPAPINVTDYAFLIPGSLDLFLLFVGDLDDLISYKMQVITGTATDNFQANYIPFQFYSKHILINVWDNPLDLALARYGTDDFLTTIKDNGFIKKLSVRGYKIKNATPGYISRYQLIIMG